MLGPRLRSHFSATELDSLAVEGAMLLRVGARISASEPFFFFSSAAINTIRKIAGSCIAPCHCL